MSCEEMFLNVPCKGSSIQTWSKQPLSQSESPKFTINLIKFVKNAIGSLKITSKYFAQLFVILGPQSLKLHQILLGHLMEPNAITAIFTISQVPLSRPQEDLIAFVPLLASVSY